MQAKHAQVLVRRDMAEILSVNVFEHEIEILRDMHGDGNIEIVEEVTFEPVEIDAAEEFDRLSMVYGVNENGQPYVERCIGRGPKQLEALGYKEPAKRGRPAKEDEDK